MGPTFQTPSILRSCYLLCSIVASNIDFAIIVVAFIMLHSLFTEARSFVLLMSSLFVSF